MAPIPLAFLFLPALQAASAPGSEPAEFDLSNGLHVRLVPAAGLGEVTVLLGIRGGIAEEPAERPHLAHLLEHATFHGLAPDSPQAQAAERGSPIRANAETMAGFVYLYVTVPSADLATGLAAAREWLAGPRFDAAVLAREVPKATSEAEGVARSPMGGTHKFAFSAFVQGAFHGREEARIAEASGKATVEDLTAFHAATFRTDRAVLALAGEFEPAAARSAIESALGSIPPPEKPAPERPVPRSRTVKWDLPTSHAYLAWPAPSAAEPDHAALTLLAGLLHARLAVDPAIRRLARHSIVLNDVERLFVVDLQAKDRKDLDALARAALDQAGRLSAEAGFDEIEVGAARRGFEQLHGLVAADFSRLPRQVPKGVAMLNLEIGRFGRALPWAGSAAYRARVDALDSKGLRAAAAARLDPKKAALVFVVPAAEAK